MKKQYHRVSNYTRIVNGKKQHIKAHKRHNPRSRREMAKRVSDEEAVQAIEKMSKEQLKADQSKKSKVVDKHPSQRWLENPDRYDVEGIDDGSRVKSQYFVPKMKGGWKKTQSTAYRRQKLLDDTDKRHSLEKRRKQAAQNAQIIANRTSDEQARKKAIWDRNYFENLINEK